MIYSNIYNKLLKPVVAGIAILTVGISCEQESNLYDGIREVTFKATANKLFITEGESITYTDSSLNVASRTWTFDGGSTKSSDQKEVNVGYNVASPSTGNGAQRQNLGYSTNLVVVHDDGSIEKNLFKIKVYPKVVPAFTASKRTVMFGTPVQFTDATLDGQSPFPDAKLDDTILWEFTGGVPATSTSRNPVVTYPKPGLYPVKLSVTRSSPESAGVTVKNDFMNITLTPPCDNSVNLLGCNNFSAEGASLSEWKITGNKGEDKNANLSISTERSVDGEKSFRYAYSEPGAPAFTNNNLRLENAKFNVPVKGAYTLSLSTFGEILSKGNEDYVYEISMIKAGTTDDGPTKLFFRVKGGAWFNAVNTKTLEAGDYYVQLKMWNPGFAADLKLNLFIDNIKVVKN